MRASALPTVPAGASPTTSVLRSALFSTWGIGVQGLSRLAYTVVIGAAFGTEALGHASALLSLSIFAALLWPTAAGNTASRYMALALRGRVDERLLARSLGLSVLVSSIVLGVASVPVGITLGNELPLALSAAWLVCGYGAYAYTRGARLGSHRAGQVAVWDTVSSAAALGLLVAVTVSGRGLLVLVPLAIGYTVFAAACWPRPRRTADGSQAADASREALGFAAWNVLAGVTTNGLLQLAMITAQVVEPGFQAGVYAAAFTLATPASMLGQAVSQVVVPAFAHRSGGATLRERGPRSLLLVFVAGAAVLFGLVAVLAPWYLPLFYPAEGEDAVPLLRFLMLGVYVFSVGLIPAALLLATGRSRAVALASVAGFVVGLVTMTASAPLAGVQAGSLGFLVGSAINLVATIVLACQPAPERVADGLLADEGGSVHAPAPASGRTQPGAGAGDEPL